MKNNNDTSFLSTLKIFFQKMFAKRSRSMKSIRVGTGYHITRFINNDQDITLSSFRSVCKEMDMPSWEVLKLIEEEHARIKNENAGKYKKKIAS